MKAELTPKQVARAIGVSESSLKRWCDRGLLQVVRTAGGHRRIATAAVFQFLRRTGRDLVEPEILGLPVCTGSGPRTLQSAQDEFLIALKDGHELTAREIVFNLYLDNKPISAICDRVIATALHRIGEAWQSGDLDIYEERRSCEIVVKILRELGQGLPLGETAEVALGGTCENDHYMLPTMMVELVLRERGYKAFSLGTNLPIPSLESALITNMPRLFWLSVSFLADVEIFLTNYKRLYARAMEQGVMLIVGGRALTADVRQNMEYTAFCDTLKHLESFLNLVDRPKSNSFR